MTSMTGAFHGAVILPDQVIKKSRRQSLFLSRARQQAVSAKRNCLSRKDAPT